jgi:prephenate dehydratase
MKRIAIQGISGCFHEEAAERYFGSITPVECRTFDDMFLAMERGEADGAVIAIENSISGGLLQNFELLRHYPYTIKGEQYLRIKQNLVALPGQSIDQIKEVHSHYMAINQTRHFFSAHPHIRLYESEDTAASAAEIAHKQLLGVGGIASELAARKYGLEILAPSIETDKHNYTRFLILDPSIEVDESRINKASLCFTLSHRSGKLAQVLSVLSYYDMNLTRIQSLPIIGKEWQYFFYVDLRFEEYEQYRQAITATRPLLGELKILGEYPAANMDIADTVSY